MIGRHVKVVGRHLKAVVRYLKVAGSNVDTYLLSVNIFGAYVNWLGS